LTLELLQAAERLAADGGETRMFRMLPIVAIASVLLAGQAVAQEKVVFANYGGTVADFFAKYCGEPFRKDTGIELEQVGTSDPLGQLKLQELTNNVQWDLFPAEGDVLVTAQNNGWLQKIDWSVVDPTNKMPPVARKEYGIAGFPYSTVLAYRTDKVPAGKSFSGWKSFWDVKNFPGPRSIRDTPSENLEFALLADGVPKEKLYDVLNTQAGVDRAFAKLDQIKSSIAVFWTSGQQPAQLIASGDVLYTTAWNGRISALRDQKVPVAISWDGASLNVPYYSIPKGAKDTAATLKFMKACLTDEHVEAQAVRVIRSPGFAPALFDLLTPEEARDLPTYKANLDREFEFNVDFWVAHRAELQHRWEAWRLK
jgi:putative spermidine/putrescine transport system substrate-binding protein